MAYTVEQLNTLIAEAQSAYHDLVTGNKPRVVVDGNNGDRVEYSAANSQRLYLYIQDLQRQLAALTTVSATPQLSPARFIF